MADNRICCRVCWRRVPIELRRANSRAYRMLGPRRSWVTLAREQPAKFRELADAARATADAIITALNTVTPAELEQIKRLMP